MTREPAPRQAPRRLNRPPGTTRHRRNRPSAGSSQRTRRSNSMVRSREDHRRPHSDVLINVASAYRRRSFGTNGWTAQLSGSCAAAPEPAPRAVQRRHGAEHQRDQLPRTPILLDRRRRSLLDAKRGCAHGVAPAGTSRRRTRLSSNAARRSTPTGNAPDTSPLGTLFDAMFSGAGDALVRVRPALGPLGGRLGPPAGAASGPSRSPSGRGAHAGRSRLPSDAARRSRTRSGRSSAAASRAATAAATSRCSRRASSRPSRTSGAWTR